jgi:hypothetical protein
VIGTLRRECLDYTIVLNERHLRGVLREYVAYCNAACPHRSLGLEPLAGPREPPPSSVPAWIIVDPVLGGLHHVYGRAA